MYYTSSLLFFAFGLWTVATSAATLEKRNPPLPSDANDIYDIFKKHEKKLKFQCPKVAVFFAHGTGDEG
jgi:hypothetical protein